MKKKNDKDNVIIIQEEVKIEQNDNETIFLEKGDKIESAEYVDNKRGEIINPRELFYNSKGNFKEALSKTL